MESLEETSAKKPKNVVFWVNVTYFIMLTLLIGVQILSKTVLANYLDALQLNFVFALIVQIGIMLIIPITAFSLIKRQKASATLKDFKVNKISFKHVCISFLIGVCVFVLNICISSLFNAIIIALGYESVPTSGSGVGIEASFINFLLVVFYSAFLPAICEEITHRGMLLNGFKKYGLTKALILSSLMFGLMHLNINQFFYASIVGLIIGFIAICANSIIPAMIVHFTNNFINTYLDFASANGWFGGNFYTWLNNLKSSGDPFIVMIISIVLVSGIVMLLMFLIRKLLLERRGQEIDNAIKQVVVETTVRQKLSEGDLTPVDETMVQYNVQEAKGRILDLISNKEAGISLEIFNDEKSDQKHPPLKDNIFFYASIVMATVMTIFTFIWGIL